MLKHFIILNAIVLCVSATKTISQVLSEDQRFETLLGHLKKNSLVAFVDTLEEGTFFAPENDAFGQVNGDISNSTLLYHILPNSFKMADFRNGALLESFYVRPGYLGSDKTGQLMKVTKDDKTTLINEAHITTGDIEVSNKTSIHALDTLLEPPMLLREIVQRNEIIAHLMNTSDVLDILEEGRPFTVFLTIKESPFDLYNPIETAYLTSDYGKNDMSQFFKYTIVDKSIYIDNFHSGKTTYKTLSGDSLTLAKSKEDGKATVNDVPIVQSDILGANGVLHEMDGNIKPSSISFNSRKYLHGLGASQLVKALDDYNLNQFLDTTETNHTYLIPPNDSINKPPRSYYQKKAWLAYHILRGSWPQENLVNNMLLTSEFTSHDMNGNGQRVPVYIENEVLGLTGKDSLVGKSIQFDHSRVVGEAATINNDFLYKLSSPLALPGDILQELVLDLDLSTFIATLYVSGVADDIKDADGITLFVPSNSAFDKLGLVAKYLVHSSAKSNLQTILRYHAALSLLYYGDMKDKVNETPTLSKSTLRISQNESGSVVIGSPENSQTNSATLLHKDMIVSNGVIHKISEVLIPNHIKITNKDILVGTESTTMLKILEKTKFLEKINDDNIVVLVPTDKAFARVDLDALLEDEYQLERLARLHLLPTPWQNQWVEDGDIKKSEKGEYASLLSNNDKITVKMEYGGLSVQVNDGGESDSARVIGLGKVKAGGGIIAIDRVLIPVQRGFFGLPWVWSIVVVLTIITLCGGLMSICGFLGYKIYNRRRLGYRPIF